LARKRHVLPPEERKEELLLAASQVISEKGYRSASISDIIEKAGVARGTFYHYFESKKDIFVELIERYFTEFAQILEENHERLFAALETGSDIPVAWRENALAIMRFHSDNPELTALVYREAMGLDENFSSKVEELSRLARNRMVEEFQMLADRGLMVPCDVELVTTMVNGAMVNIIMEYILRDGGRELEYLADALVKNQLRALTPTRPAEAAKPARKPAGKKART